ncbi:Uncharacterised protein [Acinetobacter phage MD-2021a]|nr:Uncharacterised protein [Acinetobacter phage MD-2021a]CAH1088963.1 Uncharacterised protein [Acinetobacter phage MD-2021a]
MKVNLTEEQIHSDMQKLHKMFDYFQTMSDEDIEPINKAFYGKLETAGHIALKYEFDHNVVEDFYKLKLWLEMYDQVFGESE